ncbi:MAG: hypothetical protein ACP5M4_02245 [Acidobacteriaceae bacterium]
MATHTISPESSDGFASVGTILPKVKRPPCCRAVFSVYVGGKLVGDGRFWFGERKTFTTEDTEFLGCAGESEIPGETFECNFYRFNFGIPRFALNDSVPAYLLVAFGFALEESLSPQRAFGFASE